jgi:hypothetical protein
MIDLQLSRDRGHRVLTAECNSNYYLNTFYPNYETVEKSMIKGVLLGLTSFL